MGVTKNEIDKIVAVLSQYIDGRLDSIATHKNVTFEAFINKHMKFLQGGVPLDVSLFRTFLNECGNGELPIWVDEKQTGELPADMRAVGKFYFLYNAENDNYDVYIWDGNDYVNLPNAGHTHEMGDINGLNDWKTTVEDALKALKTETVYFYRLNSDDVYQTYGQLPTPTDDDVANEKLVYVVEDANCFYNYKAQYVDGSPMWMETNPKYHAYVDEETMYYKGEVVQLNDNVLYICINETLETSTSEPHYWLERQKVYACNGGMLILLTDDNCSAFLDSDVQQLLKMKTDIENNRFLIDSLNDYKANWGHTHAIADVDGLQSKITTIENKLKNIKTDKTVYFQTYTEIESNSEMEAFGTYLLNGNILKTGRMFKDTGTLQPILVPAGEYYLNPEIGVLYKTNGGVLGGSNIDEQEPSDTVMYIDTDSGKVYAYNAETSEFAELTNEQVEQADLSGFATSDHTHELVVPILWADLKELRDNGELTAGVWYRITDYQCTTSQADTRTAGHQFDILVLAVDDHTLNENARAARHAGDTYFADCNLDAWELKYCLDNDTQRFAWADTRETEGCYIWTTWDGIDNHLIRYRMPEADFEQDGETYFAWYNDYNTDVCYTKSEIPEINDLYYFFDGDELICCEIDDDDYNEEYNVLWYGVIKVQTLPAARGVIYHLKDEWGNSCPYDFKNILFKRYSVYDDSPNGELADLDGKYLGFVGEMQGLTINEWNFVWCYTFTQVGANRDWEDNDWQNLQDASLQHGINDVENVGYHSQFRCLKNIIEMCENTSVIDDEIIEIKKVLNNIVLFSYNKYITKFGDDAIPENDFDFTYNNHFDMSCQNITISGNGNNFGQRCYQIISYFNFNSNTFGNYCYSNTFGNDCYSNTFGNDCYSNTFGNDCDSNTFGNNCDSNTFGNNCGSNTFGNYCYSNTFGNNCDSNTFGNYCGSNTFGNYCYSNTFGNDCDSNTFGNYCYSNTFGNDCNYNTFGKSAANTELTSRVYYCKIGDNVRYFDLMGDSTADNMYITNVEVQSNLQGTDDNHKVFEFEMVQWEYMANHKKTIIKSAEEDIIEL